MSNIDEFYEYAKNNFLNFLNKNNINSKNEERNKIQENKSIIKGINKKDLSDIENLKSKELIDNENYDEKYKNFIMKKKEKKEKKKKKFRENSYSVSSYDEKNDSSNKKKKKKRKYEEYKKIQREKERKKKKKKDIERDRYRDRERENKSYVDDSISDDDQNNPKNEDISPPNDYQFKNNLETHLPENSKLKIKLEKIIAEKKNNMMLKNSLNKNLVDCKYCIDSNSFNKINKLNVVSISDRSYICYYNYKNIFLKDQLFISPIEHTTSITNTNFETVKDIRNHMKSLTAMLEANNHTCIFIEFNNCFNSRIELISMRKTKHTYINCYIIPIELLEKAKIYFKKNLDDINSLYRENKQLIITDNKYAPYNIIPKKIPYVSINFSLVETYIQVIENNYDYINMCRCIFTDLFKKDKLYKYFTNFQQYVNAVEQFKSLYEKYDWTNYVNK
ncbi:debranching enzyme-associated ribonuclease, putative [Plasmodium relictum]|uniref:Debranching enzyme-associated ribonuclease, putative n=1 Tax=Plasmodium relictum TaxID=85471 RepID=A0A1J1HB24_PLARL|nr:debranching enzyme-associated ribonuclease, putative [Plasmodium relictum]CRH02628.1 debranching enzyme-associated ribonuclease, putative [Plasmodium relictum]